MVQNLRPLEATVGLDIKYAEEEDIGWNELGFLPFAIFCRHDPKSQLTSFFVSMSSPSQYI